MKKLCIYHGNCADGFGAACVIKKWFGDNVEFYAGVYQQDPPDCTGRDVIMVDFSYKRPVMEKICAVAENVVHIDHHKSAIDDLAAWEPEQGNLLKYYDLNHSGAALAWLFYFGSNDPMPPVVKYIEDRDLWRFNLVKCREIAAALFSYEYDFELWMPFLDLDEDTLLATMVPEGAAIERKHMKDVRELIGKKQRVMKIGGEVVPCINAPYFYSSDAAHLMAKAFEGGKKFAASYWDTVDARVFSLRSTDEGADVSEVAKKYGGGGHVHAAGFSIPFDRAKADEAVLP